MERCFRLASLLAAFLLAASAGARAQKSCAEIMAVKVSGATIILAESVAAGSFAGPPTPNGSRDLTAPYKNVPAFCRVVVESKPTSDSDIRIEVWMPSSRWNGKLQGTGKSGSAGQIDYENLGASVSKGFAATATDAGNSESPVDAKPASGQPGRVMDSGHRGIQEMTRVAQELVHMFYGKDAQRP